MAVPRFWREQPQRYRLVASECGHCQRVFFPPRSVCPHCRRDSLGKIKPRQLSGRGKILTHTVVRQPGEGFEDQTPYVMAIVEAEEGCRVMAQIVEVEPDSVQEGLLVEACFRRIREDGRSGVIYYGYKFRPVRAGQPIRPTLVAEAKPSRGARGGRRKAAPRNRWASFKSLTTRR